MTADVVLFGVARHRLEVLLIERAHEPYAGCWALPGGFVDVDEPLEVAARRELAEETGLEVEVLEQLAAFGDPGRDPRAHVITVAFLGLVRVADHVPRAASDAARAAWWALGELPRLAFDHDRIIAAGNARLRDLVRLHPDGYPLLAAGGIRLDREEER